MEDEEDELTGQILGVLDEQLEDGSMVYTDNDLADFLPLLTAHSDRPLREYGPAHQKLMEEFLKPYWADLDIPLDEFRAIVDTHYAKHPPHADLLAKVQAILGCG